MKENQDLLIVLVGIIISIIAAIVISQLLIKDLISDYSELEQRVIKLEDSLRVQHNYYQFTIEKDTIINKTIKIQCVK
jgi:hypothetical protein